MGQQRSPKMESLHKVGLELFRSRIDDGRS